VASLRTEYYKMDFHYCGHTEHGKTGEGRFNCGFSVNRKLYSWFRNYCRF